jgi:hypothetical protein
MIAVTSATSQTPPIDRGQAVDDDFVLDNRHSSHGRVTRPTVLDHLPLL